MPITDEIQASIANTEGTVMTVTEDYSTPIGERRPYDKSVIKGTAGNYYIDLFYRFTERDRQLYLTFDWDGEGENYKISDYKIDLRFQEKPRAELEVVGLNALQELENKDEQYDPSKCEIPALEWEYNDWWQRIKFLNTIHHVQLSEETATKLGFKDNNDNLVKEGYFEAIKITAPERFQGKLSNKTTVRHNDDETVYTWTQVKSGDNHFYQVYRVTENKTNMLTVNWEGQYEETYTFINDVIFGRDGGATAMPTTLKFVDLAKSMFAGKEQDINVSYTKAQARDNIKLSYTIDEAGKDILEVKYDEENQKWYLEAKKKGSATITVTVVEKDGTTPLKDASGKTKAISQKITVTDITVPASIAVKNITDTTAELSWKLNTTGNQIEIYALEQNGAAKLTIQDFEEAINAESALTPIETLETTKTVSNIADLVPNTTYVFYVRNVAKGGSAIGAISKPVKTTKIQAKEILFEQSFEESYAYSKETPTVINAEATLKYSEDYSYQYSQTEPRDNDTYAYPGKITYKSSNTKIATVDAKGNVTLKGTEVGTVTITASATLDNKKVLSKMQNIVVTGAATSLKAAKATVTMEVGQQLNFADFVKYDVPGGDVSNLDIIGVSIDNWYDYFEPFRKEGADRDSMIRAMAPTNKPITITFRDDSLTNENDKYKQAQVKLVIKPLRPAGTIKIENIRDESFAFAFTASPYAERYQVELLDATGKAIDGRTVGFPDGTVVTDKTIVDVDGCDFGNLTPNTGYYIRVTAKYRDAVSTAKRSGKIMTKKQLATGDENTTEIYARPLNGFYESTDQLVKEEGDDGRNRNVSLKVYANDTYILSAGVSELVRALESDSFTWSCEDKKIANIKVNKSTFEAQLTGLKAGTTKVKVISKSSQIVVAEFELKVQN